MYIPAILGTKTRAALIDREDLCHQRFFLKGSDGGLEEKFLPVRRATGVLLGLCVLARKPRTVGENRHFLAQTLRDSPWLGRF